MRRRKHPTMNACKQSNPEDSYVLFLSEKKVARLEPDSPAESSRNSARESDRSKLSDVPCPWIGVDFTRRSSTRREDDSDDDDWQDSTQRSMASKDFTQRSIASKDFTERSMASTRSAHC